MAPGVSAPVSRGVVPLTAPETLPQVLALFNELDVVIENQTILEENLAMLKQDIKVKTNSIQIEEQCLRERSYLAKLESRAKAAKAKKERAEGARGWAGTGVQ